MKRTNFLYAIIASIILFGFFNYHEFDKAKAGFVPDKEGDNKWLLHQWVVVEASEPETGEVITEEFSTRVWHFKESGFVLYDHQAVDLSGNWEIKNNKILMRAEEMEEEKVFGILKRNRNELLLDSDGLRIRLLKLDDE